MRIYPLNKTHNNYQYNMDRLDKLIQDKKVEVMMILDKIDNLVESADDLEALTYFKQELERTKENLDAF